MKYQTCLFTGHRSIAEADYTVIQKRLEETLLHLIHQGVRYFGAGGARGFDTIAALTILKLKPEFPHIKLILVLPCKNQAKDWCEKDKKIYNHILNQSDKVVYTSESYYKRCMHKRNRPLVDNSSLCICYLKETCGGTAYTVKYAEKKGLKIIYLV